MSALAPETLVRDQLIAALSLDSGAVKLGPPRSPVEPGASAVQCWVIASGGPGALPFHGAPTAGSWFEAEVQVRIRSAPDAYEGGITLARQVRDALHTKAPAGLVMCLSKTSEPLYLGVDEAGRHDFSLNFAVTWFAAN